MIGFLFNALKKRAANKMIKSTLFKGVTPEVVEFASITPGEGVLLDADSRKKLAEMCEHTGFNDANQYLQQFAEVATLLYQLDVEKQTGDLMSTENTVPFHAMAEEYNEFLHSEEMHAHFCTYYRNILSDISVETHLSTAIKRFDHACYFTDMLTGMLEHKEVGDMMRNGISSFDDFKAWEEMIVWQAYVDDYDDFEKERLAA